MANFLKETPENADYNQYWYSAYTIEKIVEDLLLQHANAVSSGKPGLCIAFLSTPSIYFSLPEEARATCYCFDFDKKWSSDRGFVFYDFNNPEAVPESLLGACDMVVVDPPFITRDVWEKYATTSKLLLKKGTSESGEPCGKVILTTVFENADMLNELLGAKPTAFLPSIPHLVYQYNLYTNYPSPVFSKPNPEIPE